MVENSDVICEGPQLKDWFSRTDRSTIILAANCVTVSIPVHGLP